MKVSKTEQQNSVSQLKTDDKAEMGKTQAPPAFSLDEKNSEGSISQMKQDGAAKQAAPEQTTPVIETTGEAWSHYRNGNGAAVDIGPNAINSLINHEDFQFRHNRIVTGQTSSLTGNFSVDMTSTIFHLGRTNVDYNITVNGEDCTVTYTLFVGDGFWDVDFIDENTLGRLGIPRYQPDGPGPNLERFGGTPYHYNTATRTFNFKNPGY